MFLIKEIIPILKDNLLNCQTDSAKEVQKVTIDSRSESKNGLYIAIIGKFNDGHNFLKQAFENGAIFALVQKIPEEFKNDSRLILVKDTQLALNQLAIYSRNRSKATIIGVTGSVGKTSVKEMLKMIFESQGKTYGTSGNLNNHFGLPLSLCNFDADCKFGIFEMGMNNSGEIEPLTKIARPDIAVITNIAPAHIGNFNNETEIALEKAAIFKGVTKGGYAILNRDNKYFELLKNQALVSGIKPENILSFGENKNSSARLINFCNQDLTSEVEILLEGKKTAKYQINTLNKITILNSLIGVLAAKVAASDFNSALKSFTNLQIPDGRGNIIKCQIEGKSLTIINDSYNSSPIALKSAIEFLAKFAAKYPKSRKIVALGDMLELGRDAISEHQKIGQYLTKNQIDEIFLVGELMKNVRIIDKNIQYFQSSEDLSKEILKFLKDQDILLVKGSRGTKMENIISQIN